MRILVLGAGGIGGYFGARIHAAGGDVTFLVRPARAAQLRENGLKVFSPFGDLQIAPKVLTRDTLNESFDVVILSCKAYDLDSAMDAIAPAVGERSVILPLLNGVRHIDTLTARFGTAHVLGGVAFISVMLAANGEIRHLNKRHGFVTGALTTPPSPWLLPLAALLGSSGIEFTLADNIEQAMWDKVVFLATLAGSTCLIRASIGDILNTLAGPDYITGLLTECAETAATFGRRAADGLPRTTDRSGIGIDSVDAARCRARRGNGSRSHSRRPGQPCADEGRCHAPAPPRLLALAGLRRTTQGFDHRLSRRNNVLIRSGERSPSISEAGDPGLRAA